MAQQVWRYRLGLLISIGVIIPIGYSGRFYLSPSALGGLWASLLPGRPSQAGQR